MKPGALLLARARELVSRGWCRGADACGADGGPAEPWDGDACAWSLLGAVVAALEQDAEAEGEVPLEELAAALYALADVIETDSLVDWNDEPSRTQEEVVATLARAEELYESPWPELANSSPN
jgi:hypothetical protein